MSWIGSCLLGGIWVGLVMTYIKLSDLEYEVECCRRRLDKLDKIVNTIIETLENKED